MKVILFVYRGIHTTRTKGLHSFHFIYRITALKVKSAAWALERGVCVVVCNGMQDNAIKTILRGRRIGTFFTYSGSNGGNAATDILAENGKLREHGILQILLRVIWPEPGLQPIQNLELKAV